MSNIIVLISLLIVISGLATADSSCGDWTSYQDEKCFKVFNALVPFSLAAHVCEKEGATIGIIESAEEQGIVMANLESQNIKDDVWIGIKKNGRTFVSLDGKALKYTLWANNRPLNQTDMECVELSEEDQDKWMDVNCGKKNAVLCEKSQQWDLAKIEQLLQQIRFNYTERMNLLEDHLDAKGKEIEQLKQNQASSLNLIETQRKDINELKQNLTSSVTIIDTKLKQLDNVKSQVPIGFIYVQLSGQSEPHSLWPQTEWNNISPNYSGLFFRAEGADSATFGQVQNEQTRRLEIFNGICGKNPNGCTWGDYSLKSPYNVVNTFSDKGFYTGESSTSMVNWYSINFRHTTDENRPRNQAIRIWIRIK